MDDFSVGASGLAWIAAYKYKRGDNDAANYANSAKNLIGLALSLEESVCAHRTTQTTWGASDSLGPCAATAGDLQARTAETVSLNHGQQTIGYGLGLMTSISSAVIGLQTANVSVNWTDDQKAVALALFREGQSRAFTSGDLFDPNACYRFTADRTKFETGANCGETIGGGYKPKMFPVRNFYTQVLGLTPPSAGYQFDVFDNALFADIPFFNRGRQSIYGDLTKCWYPSATRPALGGPPVKPPLAEVAWVRPSYASWGPADTLTVAGYTRNGSGGVQVVWRDVTANGPWQVVSWQPPPSPDGTWSNTIPVSNYCHDYEVYVNYSGSTSNTLLYSGLGSGYCPESSRLNWIQPQVTAGFGPPGASSCRGAPPTGRRAPPLSCTGGT